ncbi:CerR family C-terminal domain-containing protein [Thermodesulfobacteriota bacterium]
MSKKNSEVTKDNILDSAEVLFAKSGYNGVSIREITDAAQCNIASVHYHFGNKENLYLEVFRERWLPREKIVVRFFEDSLKDLSNPPPSKVFEVFARAYIDGPLTGLERQRQRLLVVREIAGPGEAFELVIEQIINPLLRIIMKYLEPFIKSGFTEKSLTIDILGIFGMVYYFTYSHNVVSRVMETEYEPSFKEMLINHIVSFSLNGMSFIEK